MHVALIHVAGRTREHERAKAPFVCVCSRLPTRRSRVPTALCVCRAWDRHCLLLLVLLSPGHGRRADAWPIQIAPPPCFASPAAGLTNVFLLPAGQESCQVGAAFWNPFLARGIIERMRLSRFIYPRHALPRFNAITFGISIVYLRLENIQSKRAITKSSEMFTDQSGESIRNEAQPDMDMFTLVCPIITWRDSIAGNGCLSKRRTTRSKEEEGEEEERLRGQEKGREGERKSADPCRRNKRKGEGGEGVGTVARSAADYLS